MFTTKSSFELPERNGNEIDFESFLRCIKVCDFMIHQLGKGNICFW